MNPRRHARTIPGQDAAGVQAKAPAAPRSVRSGRAARSTSPYIRLMRNAGFSAGGIMTGTGGSKASEIMSANLPADFQGIGTKGNASSVEKCRRSSAGFR